MNTKQEISFEDGEIPDDVAVACKVIGNFISLGVDEFNFTTDTDVLVKVSWKVVFRPHKHKETT